ncbi:MAG: GTPase Era [Myxococcales bacterium]|nr:GTPase Era [Myxococcales bacterium]USN50933.1 MAG: GTPase Era [Myxococcales bacterium]
MNDKKTFVTTVAFVGQPNVGKSTLLNALVGAKIAPTTRKAQTTRRIIRGIRTKNNCQQIYFDTPGAVRTQTGLDHFMHDQIFQALNDVEQVVAIVDAKDPIKKHAAFINKIKSGAEKNKQPLLLVVNKIDEIKDKSKLLELTALYAQECGIDEIIPLSAVTQDGLDNLFDALARRASESEFIFSDELFTDASEKEIVAELIREKAMLELNDELPYRIAVSVEHFDESRRENEKKPLIEIEAVLHVERKSQKAIVIGKGGASIKTIGMRARKDIEYLLNCQVMLKLFVRVEPDWTTSAKGLKKLGY